MNNPAIVGRDSDMAEEAAFSDYILVAVWQSMARLAATRAKAIIESAITIEKSRPGDVSIRAAACAGRRTARGL